MSVQYSQPLETETGRPGTILPQQMSSQVLDPPIACDDQFNRLPICDADIARPSDDFRTICTLPRPEITLSSLLKYWLDRTPVPKIVHLHEPDTPPSALSS
jgi:hypothetical protein